MQIKNELDILIPVFNENEIIIDTIKKCRKQQVRFQRQCRGFQEWLFTWETNYIWISVYTT